MHETPIIDVHGMNSEDAILTVRINLKEFYDQGYPEVFIVHGKGQGILRDKIRLLLSQTPYVKEMRPGHDNEGGDGVTIAILA